MSLALLSAALLAYEIVLVHLLAIAHWSHVAALVISLALLGFGASGSMVAVARRTLAGRERGAYLIAAVAAALSFDPAWRLAAAIPFDAFELLAVPRQIVWLSATYLTLSVPFLFGGAAVALAFLAAPDRVGPVYAANLLGSGAGAALGLVLLGVLPAERLPAAVALVAGLAAVPLGRWGALVPLALLPAALLLPPADIPVSQYKEGRAALRLPEARLIARDDGALGRLDMIGSPVLHTLPGASLTLDRPVPARPVLYLNGQPLGPRAVAADTSLLELTTTAVAFALPAERALDVLILGPGGGGPVWLARAHGADRITVVEPDRRLRRLLAPETVGPDVRWVDVDARAFLRGTERRFDRILVTEVGSLSGGAAGIAAAGAGTLFTEEGLDDLWRALEPDGVLAVTRWVLDPPRDILRLLGTVRAVLERDGARAADHVVLVRGWSTVTLLVSRSPLRPADGAALAAWAGARWFDVTWAPGVPAAAANRYNLLEPDRFRLGAEALLGPRPEPFVERYPFRIEPVTDDRPFFFHFLTLPQLIRLWSAEGRLSVAYFEWGIVAQFLVLAQAIPIAALLILLPLLALPRRAQVAAGPAASAAPATPAESAAGGETLAIRPARLFLYFSLLGLAFMLLEISAIQRLVLLLAQPIYATTVVIGGFLVFAGLGSASARRIAGRWGAWAPFAAVAVLAPAAYLAELWLWDHAAGAPLLLRGALALLVLAPVAFAMGMPFPLGLARVAERSPRWIPWCWGVNGFLSVVGAAAAPLIALGLGFSGVLVLAVGLYAIAGWTLARL